MNDEVQCHSYFIQPHRVSICSKLAGMTVRQSYRPKLVWIWSPLYQYNGNFRNTTAMKLHNVSLYSRTILLFVYMYKTKRFSWQAQRNKWYVHSPIMNLQAASNSVFLMLSRAAKFPTVYTNFLDGWFPMPFNSSSFTPDPIPRANMVI